MMKKVLWIVAFAATLLSSCYDDGELKSRLEALENRVPTLEQQVRAIEQTLPKLEAADQQLKEYTNTLQQQVANLEAKDLSHDAQIAEINRLITSLQNKDEEIVGKIEELKAYLNTQLGQTKDWVSATFATLDQYHQLVTDIAAINSQITAINNNMTALENRLNTKIDTSVADATTALERKIADCETSLKSWVTEQLKGYYTIAETDAKLQLLQATVTEGDEALQQEIDSLTATLDTTKAEITTAYQNAIQTAIEEANGVLTVKIQEEISTVNKRIDTEVAKLNTRIDALEARIAILENNRIPSIEAQIASILGSISNLQAMDNELKGYIATLLQNSSAMQVEIEKINARIEDLKTPVIEECQAEIDKVVAQLTAVKTEIEEKLTAINTPLANLEAKDAALEQQIKDLQTYVDTQLAQIKDWANATFATLEQYNSMVADVAAIRVDIQTLTQSIIELESRINTKIANDIATAVSGLETEIQEQVLAITSAYQQAIATAKSEITAAYTDAITQAIDNCVALLKTWVGEQLSHYYDIATIDAKVESLQNAISAGDTALQKEIDKLRSDVNTMGDEITTAYKNAIQTAIEEFNGQITTKIQTEIATINSRIDTEVATLNSKISALEARISKLETDVAALLKRIQSVTFVPTYSDGQVWMNRTEGVDEGIAEFDFMISPKDAVAELATVWQTALSMKTVPAQTRSVQLIDLPIIEFDADTTQGTISLKVSGENLEENYYETNALIHSILLISDGNNSVSSEYVPTIALYKDSGTPALPALPDPHDVCSCMEDIVFMQYCYDNFDVNHDGKVSKVEAKAVTEINLEGLNVKKLTGIGYFSNLETLNCKNCTQLIEVDLSKSRSLKEIGGYAFYKCSSLTSITIPDSVTEIGGYAFSGCSSLTSITIPDSVTMIGDDAFFGCSSLTSITIPDSVIGLGWYAFAYCSSLTSFVIPDSVTTIGSGLFCGCSSLTSVTIGISVKKIGDTLFYDCSASKIIVYCKPITPPLFKGSGTIFYNTPKTIYVPAISVHEYKTSSSWNSYYSQIVGYNF